MSVFSDIQKTGLGSRCWNTSYVSFTLGHESMDGVDPWSANLNESNNPYSSTKMSQR